MQAPRPCLAAPSAAAPAHAARAAAPPRGAAPCSPPPPPPAAAPPLRGARASESGAQLASMLELVSGQQRAEKAAVAYVPHETQAAGSWRWRCGASRAWRTHGGQAGSTNVAASVGPATTQPAACSTQPGSRPSTADWLRLDRCRRSWQRGCVRAAAAAATTAAGRRAAASSMQPAGSPPCCPASCPPSGLEPAPLSKSAEPDVVGHCRRPLRATAGHACQARHRHEGHGPHRLARSGARPAGRPCLPAAWRAKTKAVKPTR